MNTKKWQINVSTYKTTLQLKINMHMFLLQGFHIWFVALFHVSKGDK